MNYVIRYTITIVLHTLGSKGEIVVKSLNQGLMFLGTFSPYKGLILLEHHLRLRFYRCFLFGVSMIFDQRTRKV